MRCSQLALTALASLALGILAGLTARSVTVGLLFAAGAAAALLWSPATE